MRKIMPLFMAVFFSAVSAVAGDYSIDEYQFDWIVHNKGDLTFRVVKTQDTILIRVDQVFGELDLTPQEAVMVAAELKKTDDYYKVMREGKKDDETAIQSGDVKITFAWSEKDGFIVKLLTMGSGFGMANLERNDAKAFARIFPEAVEMAGFIDVEVDF